MAPSMEERIAAEKEKEEKRRAANEERQKKEEERAAAAEAAKESGEAPAGAAAAEGAAAEPDGMTEKERRRAQIEAESQAKRAQSMARLEEKKRKKLEDQAREKAKIEAEEKRKADLMAAQEAAEAEEPSEAAQCFCKRGGNIRQRERHGTGRVIQQVFCVRFSPDAKMIATASIDKSVRIWDVVKDDEIVPIDHKEYVRCVEWVDADHVVTGCDDRAIRLWRIEEKCVICDEDDNLEQTFSFHDWIVCMCLSPDGEWVCGVTRNEVTLHRLHPVQRNDKRRSTLGRRNSSAHLVVERQQSKQSVGVASSLGTASRRGSKLNEDSRTFAHDYQTWSASFSPDSTMLVTASNWEVGNVIIWDVASGDELLNVIHQEWVNAVAWSPFGRKVLTCSRDKYVRVWELPSSVAMKSGEDLRLQKEEEARQEEERLEAEKNQKKIRISKKKQQDLKEQAESEAREAQITAEEIFKFQHTNWSCEACWSPDGKMICSTSDTGDLRLFCIEDVGKFEKGQQMVCFEQDQPICCVDFASHGRRICTGGKDGTTRVYGGLHHLWKAPQAIEA